MRYLITFACYGNHIHGDESGTVDREHNVPGHRLVAPDLRRADFERQRMSQPSYRLDGRSRQAVLSALRNHCQHRGWALLAAHVRTNHVHVIVEAEVPPERAMVEFKAYASRQLNDLRLDSPDRKRWARHGSTRWLWKDEDVRSALAYVIERQGDPMDLFVAEEV